MKISVIKIDSLKVHEHHLEIIYSADKFQFSTKIFYHDVSFSGLMQKYSQPFIQRIVSHIALFEGMKLCSLFPEYYDISVIAEYLEPAVLDLFVQIYQGVFGQHWYENNITDYQQPEIITSQKLGVSQPAEILGNHQTILAGCGGGKDSILAMKMLEEAGIPFASMQYSHSVYGKADFQHHLISQVLECVKPTSKHQISIFDDFTDFPFLKLYFPENSGITAPETPVSIFESLILMLDQGYNYLCLAHEKSANTGNLFWDEIDKEVNHQWGKGLAAEQILDQFIREHLLTNFKYFSILQPIYDYRIFQNFSKYPEFISKIHSCNVQKPWCKKCPKCAYVWLGLMAFSQQSIVNEVFKNNLFDDVDLLPTFREMVGLGEHTPFECIGEIEESRLLMKRCLERGLTGKALDIFTEEILSDRRIKWQEIEQKYNFVYSTEHAIPDWIFEKIKEQL
ncbi:hypothetical protein [Sphaerospermopsis torques-reginae]|jgi:hypothetical protein|uniref:UDP-N-acetyl-alpha-D-muramoyl-L-alanyl-L-glutamate epimerase n=1 Tax=Sphaerospermopsis torques-reginae ITEP-024 TaxID=984208 RepID=A0ABX8WXF0_9CYAN|nr:hypothetical protein [Sphaerospermopsis torques-reginae]QYX31042.1 hypothetical protein K2F26_19640 [Sphaerospermopsis torques-reginae ITEP-024]